MIVEVFIPVDRELHLAVPGPYICEKETVNHLNGILPFLYFELRVPVEDF
jgi:hypothetical protein